MWPRRAASPWNGRRRKASVDAGPQTVALLARRGIPLLRTDRDGSVAIESDGPTGLVLTRQDVPVVVTPEQAQGLRPRLIGDRRAREHPCDLLAAFGFVQLAHRGARAAVPVRFFDPVMVRGAGGDLRAVCDDQHLALFG